MTFASASDRDDPNHPGNKNPSPYLAWQRYRAGYLKVIPVTDEMIDAGLQELYDHHFGDNEREVLRSVFSSMAYRSPAFKEYVLRSEAQSSDAQAPASPSPQASGQPEGSPGGGSEEAK